MQHFSPQVIEDADVSEECYKLSNMLLDHSEGPLWKCRFLPWSPKQASYVEYTSAAGEKPKFPHVCHFIFASYHSNTDGFSGVSLMNSTASFLDDALSGNPADDDEEQIAVFLDPKNIKRETEKAMEHFRNNPEDLNQKIEYLKSCLMYPDFLKAFPVQSREKPTTLVIPHVADTETTRAFIARCKQEKVTVHAGLCSVIEATAVRLMRARGLNQKSFDVSSAHTVNARAHYSSRDVEVGYGVQHYHMLNEVPADVLQNFWNFARVFNKRFREDMANKMSVQEDAIKELMNFSCFRLVEESDYLNNLKLYTTANVGDVTNFLGRHERVQVEYFIPYIQYFRLNFLFFNASHTIRGRLSNSLFYNTHLMESDTAQLFSDSIFETMANVTNI